MGGGSGGGGVPVPVWWSSTKLCSWLAASPAARMPSLLERVPCFRKKEDVLAPIRRGHRGDKCKRQGLNSEPSLK